MATRPAEPIEHIGQLRADSRNARRHNPRNTGMIERALGEVGAARSIVIDEAGTVLAGNATVEAAAAAGIERVQVVDADGETIIAVRRTGLTPEQKTRLAYYDNRTAELADWDLERIAADAAAGVDFAGLWSDGELAGLLARVAGAPEFDPAAEWGGMPEYAVEDRTPIKRLMVNFAAEADYRAFGTRIGQTIAETTKWIWFPPLSEGRVAYADED